MCGPFSGFIKNVNLENQKVQGSISGRIGDIGAIFGNFNGHINPQGAEIIGTVTGVFQCSGMVGTERTCLGIKACLRPYRRIDLSQVHDGKSLGGITIQIQVPIPGKLCSISLPPTDTHVLKQK